MLDTLIALVLFFGTTLLPGLVIIYFFKLKTKYLQLILAYGLGTAVLSLELFLYFFIFRFSVSIWLFIFIFLQAIGSLIFLFIKRGEVVTDNQQLKKEPWQLKEKVVAIFIGIVIIFSLTQGLTKPPLAYDAMVLWSLRAKILMREGQINFNPDSYVYLGSPHYRSYPWQVSLSEYWLRQLGAHETGLNILPIVYFIGIIFLIYYAVSQRVHRLAGLVFSLVFATMPLIFYHSFNTYADLILAYYVTVSVVFFMRWLDKRTTLPLVVSALFIGLTLLIKNEGIFYISSWILALGVGLYMFKQKLTWQLIRYVGISLILPVLSWLVFRSMFGLQLSDSPLVLQWQSEVIHSFIFTLFTSNNWNIWWFLFLIIVAIKAKKIWFSKRYLPWWVFFIYLGLTLCFLYFLTQRSEHALNLTAIARTFIPLIPISLLGLALIFENRENSID